MLSQFSPVKDAPLEIPSLLNGGKKGQINTAKTELLQTISNTKNGKEASLDTQKQVASLVDFLETEGPTSPTLLTNAAEAQKIDGEWFLQYTQPSELEGASDTPTWKPASSDMEVVSKLETRPANNRGSVSATFLKVDTSEKLTTQTIDISEARVTNFVEQDAFTVEVAGGYELDSSVANRVIVSFDTAKITLKNAGDFVLDLGFLFQVRAFLNGGVTAGGWLETTYIDDDMRVGGVL
ncbi:MAG: hypothetical protein SGARI_002072 [Bacillariaceae sp.]